MNTPLLTCVIVEFGSFEVKPYDVGVPKNLVVAGTPTLRMEDLADPPPQRNTALPTCVFRPNLRDAGSSEPTKLQSIVTTNPSRTVSKLKGDFVRTLQKKFPTPKECNAPPSGSL